jgi:hypothetical protein
MNPCDPVVSRTCPRWLAEEDIPSLPQHLCNSRTLVLGGSIKWFEGDGPEDGCPTYP